MNEADEPWTGFAGCRLVPCSIVDTYWGSEDLFSLSLSLIGAASVPSMINWNEFSKFIYQRTA